MAGINKIAREYAGEREKSVIMNIPRIYLTNTREEKKMSKLTVANMMGISRNYYHYIETGERQKNLDLSLILKLSKVFDVSVDFIIAEEEKIKVAALKV